MLHSEFLVLQHHLVPARHVQANPARHPPRACGPGKQCTSPAGSQRSPVRHSGTHQRGAARSCRLPSCPGSRHTHAGASHITARDLGSNGRWDSDNGNGICSRSAACCPATSQRRRVVCLACDQQRHELVPDTSVGHAPPLLVLRQQQGVQQAALLPHDTLRLCLECIWLS